MSIYFLLFLSWIVISIWAKGTVNDMHTRFSKLEEMIRDIELQLQDIRDNVEKREYENEYDREYWEGEIEEDEKANLS